MKLFSVLIAFKIGDQLVERTINDVHTIMVDTSESRLTESIDQFLKGKHKVTRYISFQGDKTKFDIQFPGDVIYVEIYSV